MACSHAGNDTRAMPHWSQLSTESLFKIWYSTKDRLSHCNCIMLSRRPATSRQLAVTHFRFTLNVKGILHEKPNSSPLNWSFQLHRLDAADATLRQPQPHQQLKFQDSLCTSSLPSSHLFLALRLLSKANTLQTATVTAPEHVQTKQDD